jgi:hypothetical protein
VAELGQGIEGVVEGGLNALGRMVEQSLELSRDVVQPPFRPAEGLPCFRRGVRAELLGRLPCLFCGIQSVGGGLAQRSLGLSGELLESIARVTQSLLGVPAKLAQVPFAASREERGDDRDRDQTGLLHGQALPARRAVHPSASFEVADQLPVGDGLVVEDDLLLTGHVHEVTECEISERLSHDL